MLTVDDPPPTSAVTPLPVPHAHCDPHFSVVPPAADRPGHIELLYATALYDEASARSLVDGFVTELSRPASG